jgi:small-conductance mechanosensitive channel
MKKMNPKLTTNKILFLVALVGLLVVYALSPDPKVPEMTISLPTAPAHDPDLPLPPARPRERGLNPFDRPFLFKLGGTDKITALDRESLVAAEYQRILAELSNQAPEVEVREYSGFSGVSIGGKPFLTVLATDCPDYYTKLSEGGKKQLERQVAEQWKFMLQRDLAGEQVMRSPAYLAHYPYIVAMLFFLCLLLLVVEDVAARRWFNAPGWSLKLLLWMCWLAVCFFLHPTLKPIAALLGRGILRPVFLALVICILMNLLYHVGCVISEHYIKVYLKGYSRGGRRDQRIVTMTQAGRFLIAVAAAIGGLTWFLIAVGVPVEKLFTGAGFAGVAISLIGRDILLDYFFGFKILLGDYFSIGDWIEADKVEGTVVSFNLRSTQVRESDGGLSIVTNGMLNRLKNHSRDWAHADFRIGVAYGSDPDRCMALILEEIEGLARDWPDKLESTPVLNGVEELGESSVILRALVKTAPLAQWKMGRELNRRVLLRFGREGVEIPFPQRKIWIEKEKENH